MAELIIKDNNDVIVANPERRKVFDKEKMALRGLKITWVRIAILFISCSIILKKIEFKNSKCLLFPKRFLLFLCPGKPVILAKNA